MPEIEGLHYNCWQCQRRYSEARRKASIMRAERYNHIVINWPVWRFRTFMRLINTFAPAEYWNVRLP